MKRILILIFALFFITIEKVQAEVIPHKIYAVSEKTIEGGKIINDSILEFRTIDEYKITKETITEKNAEITIKVKEYVNPKRGKRDGYFKVQLLSYTIPSKNETVKLSNNLEGTLRLSTPKDFKDIAKSAGVSITGHILKVPGFSQAIAVSKGLVKPNPDQNRLQSAGKNLYESTPLTYVEKGKDLYIEEDAIIVLSIKEHEEDE